jgi:multicomponent K+:H+ antiporter subunit D
VTLLDHLVIAPILLPLLAAILILTAYERTPHLKASINVTATVLQVVVGVLLVMQVDGQNGPSVYLLGNWAPPFSILLVADRIAALLVLLTAVLALAALLFSLARWQRAGTHFHPLFQLFLMGVSGAFLTGDLFNLFVFFEVMLAASYGLVFYPATEARVRAGLHYLVINLFASLLFLIGVALIYSVTGTLNMAHLATVVPALDPAQKPLLHAGAAVLAVAFLIKAGAWPLCFWLATTYAAAIAPVAAVLAIASKVGVYTLLRLWQLMFDGNEAFAGLCLLLGGLATVLFGTLCVLASQELGRLAGYSVLLSSGTVLAVIGTGSSTAIGAALFYLVSSTLALGAFWLLVELAERGRSAVADLLAVTQEAFGTAEESDLEEPEPVGVIIPATMALLGLSFIGCALLLAGMPPLSGFLGKYAMLAAVLGGDGSAVGVAGWSIVALLLLSGFASLIGFSRAGMRLFWPALPRTVPTVRVIEMAPIGLLLALCLAMMVGADRMMAFTQAAAAEVSQPVQYVEQVLATLPYGGGEGG